MKNFFEKFAEFSALNEAKRFGVSYDVGASHYIDNNYTTKNYATKTVKPRKFKDDIYTAKDLKKYGISPIDYRGWEKSINDGLLIIKDFVDKTDFRKMAEKENWTLSLN